MENGLNTLRFTVSFDYKGAGKSSSKNILHLKLKKETSNLHG